MDFNLVDATMRLSEKWYRAGERKTNRQLELDQHWEPVVSPHAANFNDSWGRCGAASPIVVTFFCGRDIEKRR